MTDTLTTHQFSAISEHSLIQGTLQTIKDWLTSLPQDSLASHSPLLESKKENQTPEIFGQKPESAYAWYDPDSRSWKTYQVSLFTSTYSEFSETWPKAGMIVDGKLYLRQKWEHRINVIGSGFWRTPASKEPGISPERLKPIEGGELGGMNRHFDKKTGRMAQIGLTQQVKLRRWCTPHTSDGEGGIMEMRKGVAGHYKLRDHVQNINKVFWPTVQNKKDETDIQPKGQLNPDWVEIGASRLEPMEEIVWLDWEIDPADGGVNLATAVQMWPSPRTGNPGSRPNQKGGKILAEEAKKINGTGPIPRVTTNTKDRVNRLKALGNGMVPLCVTLAWNLLTDTEL